MPEASRHDVSAVFLAYSPEWEIDWPDGSSANRYGPFIVLWDSLEHPMVYLVSQDDDESIRQEMKDKPAENWSWWEYHEQVCDYPDTPADSETLNWLFDSMHYHAAGVARLG